LQIDASVIVSTYNRLIALELTLEGFRRQTTHNFEVIVADDGSTDETKNFLIEHKDRYPFPLRHVWHEDDGFQKARILNKSIAVATAPLIIFDDGDCIPEKHFVEAHIKMSEPGRFTISRSVLLSEKFSKRVDTSYIARGNFDSFNIPLLFDYIFGKTRFWEYSLYLKSDFALGLVQKFKKSKTIFGGNFSVSKDDLIKVNGFNEEFVKWGNEDGELGSRLMNSGVMPTVAIARAINFHYYHPRPHHSRNDDNVQRSADALHKSLTHCEKGLDQYL